MRVENMRTYVAAKEQTRGQCFSTPVSACRVTVVPRRLRRSCCAISGCTVPRMKNAMENEDIHDTATRKWLKNQANLTKPIALQREISRSALQEHKTSPEVVQCFQVRS